jgi:hypothetical protein
MKNKLEEKLIEFYFLDEDDLDLFDYSNDLSITI